MFHFVGFSTLAPTFVRSDTYKARIFGSPPSKFRSDPDRVKTHLFVHNKKADWKLWREYRHFEHFAIEQRAFADQGIELKQCTATSVADEAIDRVTRDWSMLKL